MGRKKRPHNPPSPPQVPREEPFHTPFQQLGEYVRQMRPAVPPVPTAPPTPARQQPEATRSTASPATRLAADIQARLEQALFVQAMTEVTPLQADKRGRVDKPRSVHPLLTPPVSPETDELGELRDFVEGRSAFTIQYTDEYVEGVAPGVDTRLAQRLHRGDYAVQAHYDLHGHTVEEAHLAVTRFLTTAYATGRRCVLLIHGRGRNSKGNRPVLKEQVQLWLSHGRLSRMVLAFATAPPTDGGAGAVCVLLRRAPHLKQKP